MPGPLRAVELVHVRMPLVVPFRTAHGTTAVRDALLVHAFTDTTDGWGECAAPTTAGYSDETLAAAHALLRDVLVPRALAGASIDGVAGARFARAALAAALLDAWCKEHDVSLAHYLGATRPRVEAGVAIGITGDAVTMAERYVAAGYRRVKLKIAPDVPVSSIAAVRAAVGPEIALQADANGSFTLDDTPYFATLDECALQCVEQPLAPDDLASHVELARRIATPICLDESISSAAEARAAVDAQACRIVNVKPGRLGGIDEAVRVHDLCVAAGARLLCGGMLETGIGRAVNVALASLPGFTVPGDLSASDRYFAEDLTEPFVLDDGYLRVPDRPGIGVEVRADVVARYTVSAERL